MSKRLYQHDDTGRMCYTDNKVSDRYFDITSSALEVMARAVLFSHSKHCLLRDKSLSDDELDRLYYTEKPEDCADPYDYNYCGNCTGCRLFVPCGCAACNMAREVL